MKKLFIPFVFLASWLAAIDEMPEAPGLTSIESEPSGIIDGCVNVISGQFFDHEVDLIIPGPIALKVERLLQYNNPHPSEKRHALSWTFSYDYSLKITHKTGGGEHHAHFTKGLDNPTFFIIPKTKKMARIGTPQLKQFEGGITNCSKGAIGAQTNPMNRKLTWIYDHDLSYVKLEDGRTLNFKGKSKCELTSEEFPNGLYHLYDNDRVVLKRKKQELGHYIINKKKSTIVANDGRTVTYTFDNDKITKVVRPNAPEVTYSYYDPRTYQEATRYYPNGEYEDREKLKRKSYPENRYKEVVYYTGPLSNPNDPHFKRTRHLLAPLESSPDPYIKYSFHYHLPNGPSGAGCTGIYDALNRKTDYDYNDRQRLTSIKKYFADESLYTIESLFWGPQDSHLGMRLYTRSFKVENQPYSLFARHYTYDDKGNILEDNLYGTLTGANPSTLHVDPNGTISGNSDCLKKTYKYSGDSLNLVTECTVGSLKKTFHYKEKTNLLEACFHSDEQGIFLRHFYTYDINGLVIEHITDDGSGDSPEDLSCVTQRKIELIKRSDTYPYGLPEEVYEYYLDPTTRTQHLAFIKLNQHDSLGRLIQQKTWGSDGQFAYVESKTYDHRGNLKSEINRLGQEIVRDYDPNDNLTYQKGIDPRFEEHFKYDYMNRLYQIDEVHPDGTLSKHYRYDRCGNPIATIDALGNETNTEYDSFNRPIRVIGAPLPGGRPVTSYEYDALSYPIKITSPEGHSTEFAYTLFGKPYLIRYPDGTEERFEYDLEGRLLKEIAKNGAETRFTYDVQGRITQKASYSSSGTFLFQTKARYNTFHLLEEVDAAGTTTTYTYDIFGRKTTQVTGDLITTFEYDALSRPIKTTLSSLTNPEEGTSTCTLYDLLDRVIEERIESCGGVLLTLTKYSYDTAGNKCRIEQADSVTLMEYDTHGIPVKITDPEGNISFNRLILNHYNSDGQQVFAIERTDPQGVISLSIQDTHGRIVETLKKDPFGNILQKTTYHKNSSGLCTATFETVYLGNQILRTIKNRFEYDSSGRHIATVQAADTPDEKKSSITYNSFGQKASTTTPSGQTLFYTYDSLGRLSETNSSDKTIHYRYTYDINSNPILVENLIDKNATHRTYDPHSRLLQETLANSLSCQMTYTPEGHLKHLTLPDTSSIHYTYEGPLLKQVDRHQNQTLAYSHHYLTHDLAGKLQQSSLIHHLGTLTHQFNRKGQITHLSSPFYSQNASYDSLGNLISRTYQDPLGTKEEQFTYDLLNQLSSEDTHTYTHDSLYNRCSKNSSPHTHNALNQLLSDGQTEFTYDLSGNLLSEKRPHSTRTFTYDSLNRLKTLHIDNQSWEFFYDEQNRCISYTHNGTLEHILYLNQNDIGTTDASCNIHTLRILGKGLGAEIGAAVAIEIENTPYAPLHDPNGNLTTLIDPSAAPAATYRYTSFGEELTSSALKNPWRFASKRSFGDYLLFGRRFYNPSQGRWLTPDPLGYSAGPNLYAYVSNNPLTHFDPWGLAEGGFWDGCRDLFDSACDFISRAWDSVRDGCERAYDSLREGVRSIFDSVRETTRMVGASIKFLSDNVVILPFVRDFGSFLGHVMENGTYRGYSPSWELEKSKHVKGNGAHYVKLRILLVNGVNTTMEEFKLNMEHARQIFGYRVDGAYNSTQCLTVDLIETALQKLGFPSDSVEVLVKSIRDCIQEVGPDGIVVVIAHSQGAEILHNALKQLSTEERRILVTHALGPARFTNNDALRYSLNNVSTNDFIPLGGDPKHYRMARNGEMPNVKFSNSLEPDLFLDHSFRGKTYTNDMKDFADYLFTRIITW